MERTRNTIGLDIDAMSFTDTIETAGVMPLIGVAAAASTALAAVEEAEKVASDKP